ncbi:MAG TPA: prepilin-type N-terminal cleavage/methylation domain-containing protein [Capsulimonadaceae bacterium]|nr:prepilin-type N-terminal cleavage/methylation domain-containing protein [Capsulimonadaceae bacterium]
MSLHTISAPHGRRKRVQGFTLIEVTIAMVIFLMMVLMFAAVFPLAVRGAVFSNNYAQGVALCQHKMDQLRDEGWNKMDYTDLNNDGIVDTATGNPSIANGLRFTTTDSLSSFYPAGCTGTIKVNTDSNITANTVDDAQITITWTTANGGNSSYTLWGIITKNEPS